jgi:hypothetical protein
LIIRYVRVGEMAVVGAKTPDDVIVDISGHVHHVGQDLYAESQWPFSMRGMAYFVTKSFAAVMLTASFGRKPIGLDDKYITGVWARKAS